MSTALTTEPPGTQAVIPNIHNPPRTPPVNSYPMPPTTDRCGRCARPMLRRGGKLPPGFVRHHIRGNCNTCASNLRRPPLPHGNLKRGPNRGEPDPVVVDRVLSGDRLPMNTAELATIVDTMTRRGLSAREIATRIGCTADTVHRHRTRLRHLASVAA